MKRGPVKPSATALVLAGTSSCLLAILGFVVALATWFSTALAPAFFPDRWLGIVGGGLVPAGIAAAAFLAGLRLHDRGERRTALRAFSVSLVGLPLLLVGSLYAWIWAA